MRTEYCGQLRLSHEGQQVTLCGWVNRRRDLGSLIFIDMRDREGIVQVFFDPDRADALKLASELRNEFCIQVTGTVRARDAKNVNADMATGEIRPADVGIVGEMIARPLAPSDRLIRASKPLLSIMPPVGTFSRYLIKF